MEVEKATRRRFLQNTAVGVSLSRSAMPSTRRDVAPVEDARGTDANSDANFVYGTHFYHPQSGPRPDQFKEMIDAIVQKYHFNIIRVYPPWDYYNPNPGEFRFDDLEQLFNICDEAGVRVLMTVILESTPYWLEQQHPETRYVNAQERALHLGASGGSYTGGWPGLCMDWEVVRAAASHFIAELAKLSISHRSFYAWDVWNEVELVRDSGVAGPPVALAERLFCYCNRTVAEFQGWLQQRYGTLDRLNEAWIRRYPNWKAIDPPRMPVQMYTDWIDWRKFLEERSADYMRFRINSIRSVDPDHLLESHLNHFPPISPATLAGTQGWRLGEQLNVFGISFYPMWFKMPVDQAAATIEITRSYAKQQNFWITEMQAGHANEGYWRSAPVRARELRFWNWLAVTAGARGLVYWTYLTEGTGREASGFGLTTRDGSPTERVEEAAATNGRIQRRWELLREYRVRPEIALLYDQDNALLTFAMSANETPSTQSFAGYYKAFWNLDCWVDFIEPSAIANSQYKIIVAPWHLIGKKATLEALRSFSEQGGTVILESAFGFLNEQYYLNSVIPPLGLDESFGYREQESVFIEEGKLPIEALDEAPPDGERPDAEIEFHSPVQIRLKAHTYLTPIEILSARPIARSRGWTVAAVKPVGRGNVYYLGTNFGAAINENPAAGAEILNEVISGLVRRPATSAGKLRPRLITKNGRGLLAVFNGTDADQRSTIHLDGKFSRATEIYSGQNYPVENNQIALSVPFRSVMVFDLE